MSERFIYVMCKTVLCPGLSAGIWNLHRPLGVRKAHEHGYYCAWYPHLDPQNPYSVLEIPREETVALHLREADQSDLLTSVLMAFVQDGAITVDELQGIVGAVTENAGGAILVADMIPASWAPYVFDTRKDAAAAGFFEVEE
jgi:hypothetical protein